MPTDVVVAPVANVLAIGLPEAPYAVADLPVLLDYLDPSPLADERGSAVVIVSRAPGTAPVALAQQLRGLARGCDIALVVLHAPQVVVDLTTRLVAGVAGSVSADLVPEFARRVAAEISCAAVIDDVSKLRTPVPSLAQHARSLFPGAVYTVTADQRLVSGREPAMAAWRAAMAEVRGVRLASHTPPRPAMIPFLAALPNPTTTEEQASKGRNPYWGARHHLEVAWLARPVEAVAAQVNADAGLVCANCGRRSAREVCAYCSTVTKYVSRRQQGVAA